MKNYYIYKITINNPNSSFHNCYYYGKRICNCDIYNDNYFGSGLYIKQYKKKYKTFGLIKEIIYECNNEEELNQKEIEIISQSINDNFNNGGFCLNIAKGGNGGDVLTHNPKRNEIINKINKNRNYSKYEITINGVTYNSIKDASIKLNISVGRIKKFLKTNNILFLNDNLYSQYIHEMKINLLKGKTYEEIYGEEKAKEKKKELSIKKMGKKPSKASIQKGINTKKLNGTNKMSEETKKKMSNSRIKWQKTHVHTCVGRKLSNETKRKIGLKNKIALTGKKQNKELIEKRSKSIIGRKHYNNGIEQGFFYPGQEPEGWKLGKLKCNI